ncbi:hypothetical protein B0J13DRAFT_628125 [Dactylonectria estremocensis]|uniref:Uncharacterized protein n=1 Tax=Dactylonectria estremocensis TaxID=1079267 RepID=A0A9P9DT54_9HYPO|nr:hypothetical protein B0J13DRAFT_628125 [Dactylonectria estremocensis]
MVNKLDDLLDRDAIVSRDLKGNIKLYLQDCDNVLEEENKNDKGMAFTSKMRLLRGHGAVSNEVERLQMQLQTVLLLISCVRQKDHKKQDGALRQPGSKKAIAKSVRDARSVMEGRNNRPMIYSTRSTRPSDKNMDTVLTIDEEILKSGPYVAHYRNMFMNSIKGCRSAAPVHVPHPAAAKDQLPPRRRILEQPRERIQQALVEEQ